MKHRQTYRPWFSFNCMLFRVSRWQWLNSTHHDIMKFLWCQIRTIFLKNELFKVISFVGIRVLARNSELFFFVVKYIFWSDITKFFPITVHKIGCFYKSKKDFPNFWLRKFLIIDTFFAIFNLPIQWVRKIIVNYLSK